MINVIFYLIKKKIAKDSRFAIFKEKLEQDLKIQALGKARENLKTEDIMNLMRNTQVKMPL